MTAELFGESLLLPLVIAPTGFNGMLRPQGDLALAKAAAAAGIPFTLSTVSNYDVVGWARTARQDLVPALSGQGPEDGRPARRPRGRGRLRGSS
jgi:isopentenyl diphosphate isomerase/L-lactate dehydrogenase-like FMN-dependent dehydrogenase